MSFPFFFFSSKKKKVFSSDHEGGRTEKIKRMKYSTNKINKSVPFFCTMLSGEIHFFLSVG